jgi:hypothetical protein
LDQTKNPAIGHAVLDKLEGAIVRHVVEKSSNVRIASLASIRPLVSQLRSTAKRFRMPE